MGILQVFCYPTKIFLNLADHSYVSCGSGAIAWGCWGGKVGGVVVEAGQGSTCRAEAIAGADERAGITHYLVNGVCHQAANRILMPANIVARKARGYLASVAAFRIYGREFAGLGSFRAPFFQYVNKMGDISQCLYSPALPEADVSDQEGGDALKSFIFDSMRLHALEGKWVESITEDDGVGPHMSREEVERALARIMETRLEKTLNFELRHFALLLHYRARVRGEDFDRDRYLNALRIRRDFEVERVKLELSLAADPANNWRNYVQSFDSLMNDLQQNLQRALHDRDYVALLDISPDERIVLSDPEIVESVYAPSSSPSRPRPPGF